MNKNKYCIAAVFFPKNKGFFGDFLNSLKSQTYKDFDTLVFNDGVYNINELDFGTLNVTIIDCSGTPIEIREKMINYLFTTHYDYFSFIDSDDYISPQYIQTNYLLLQKSPCVSNDLTIVDNDGKILETNFWSNRLRNQSVFSEEFLYDKNILGLGNTSICRFLLKPISIAANIVAIDWYIFSKFIKGYTFTFSTDAFVYYRQHIDNTIGVLNVSEKKLTNILIAKKLHYIAIDDAYTMKEITSIEDSLETSLTKIAFANYLNLQHVNYFWWEETNYYNKFYNEYNKTNVQKGNL